MSRLIRIILLALLAPASLGVAAQDAIRGDINGDGKLTLADAGKLCDMLLGIDATSQTSFNTNFDNNNSRFSICDVTSLVKMINTKQSGNLDIGIGGWEDGGEDFGGTVSSARQMTIENSVAEVLIPITYDSFNGFQLDIQLPDSCQFVPYGTDYVKLVTPANESVLKYRLTGPSSLKVAGYMSNNKAFAGGEGFLAVQVTTATNAAPHVFSVDYSDIELSKTSDCTAASYSIPKYSYAEYLLTFKVDGNTVQSGYCEVGTKISSVAPQAPEKPGYTFSGWGEMPDLMPANDLTLNAVYSPVQVSQILLNASELNLRIGDTATLSTTILPDNALDKAIRWSSSDQAVATVSESGVVSAVGTGEAVITATAADGSAVTASCAVKVSPVLVQTITLDAAKLALNVGDSRQLKATISPENATDKGLIWSSSDVAVAKVNEEGIVTAVGIGEAVITVAAADGSGMAASCAVKVSPVFVQSIVLDATELTLKIGDSHQLSATVAPENATDKEVVWTTSTPSVATVDNAGLIRAISPGEAVITVDAADGSGVSASCVVKVSPVLVQTLVLDVSELTLEIGTSRQLSATVAPENATDKHVTWSSSDQAIASVDESGVVTAVGIGEAVITATAADGSGVKASCSVKVNPVLVQTLVLDASELTLEIGTSHQLSATVGPENATDKRVTWSSSNQAVAIVNESGIVSTVGLGETVITATAADGSGVKASCAVKVNPALVRTIVLDVSELGLNVGDSRQISATVGPENASNKEIVWASSNPSIVTVDKSGVVSAIAVGEAVITATAADGSGITASCVVKVYLQLVQSIILDASELTMDIGDSRQLSAAVGPENATDKRVIWSSSDQAVATVSESGVVTAVAPGQAEITATAADGSGVKASCAVKVNPVLVQSITLDASELTLEIGTSHQLSATVGPENATDKRVIWTSSDQAIATVNESGIVTAVGIGEAVITATGADGSGVKASCAVKVNPVLVQTLVLDVSELTLEIGTSRQLSATVAPENATDKHVTWSSSDQAIATVTETGVVSAVGLGEAVITATAADGSGVKASCAVKVNPVLVQTLVLDASELTLEVGESHQLTATVGPDNATDKRVIWSSDNKLIATVSDSGLITIVGEGSTTIRVRTVDGSGLEATCNVLGKSGINLIFTDETPFDIYDLQGRCIVADATMDHFNRLVPGIYIINRNHTITKIRKQ